MNRLSRLMLTAVVIWGGLTLLPAGRLAAQGENPGESPALVGPLLAGNSPDNAGLWLLDVTTGQQRDLSLGRGRQWFGSFSPDGCRFVFTMSEPDGPPGGGPDGHAMRLYSARIDGTEVRKLLSYTDDTGAVSWEAWTPQWSANGRDIAFVLIRDYDQDGERLRTTHIAHVSPEGGVPVLYSISGTEGQPIWSPDGGWLAYISYELGPSGQRENEVWIVSADGGTKYQLTTFESGSAIFPRWSPRGDVISFIYAPSGNNHQFWTTPASGGAVQQWSQQETLVLAYDWLPDGSGLVAAIKGWQGYDDNLLWRVPLPGWADTDATLYLNHPEATAVDYPRFSPDGRYLAFRSAYSAMLYTVETGDLRLLEGAGYNNSPMVWSPPGFAGEAACP